MNTVKMESRWMSLLIDMALETERKTAYENIAKSYAEATRYYHTLNHIEFCLNFFDKVIQDGCDFVDPFSLELSIWFHDVIYKPTRHDNEVRSAAYASEILANLGVNKDKIGEIRNFIMLTKHPSKPGSNDEKLLVDIDLSILAADQVVYDKYENDISLEYAHLPRFLYKRGRKKFLKSLLKMDSIFFSSYFVQSYEEKAKNNLQRAIEML